jgi:hypothetical protein
MDYNEIMQKIHELRRSFHMEYRRDPNTVIMDIDKYYTLLDHHKSLFSIQINEKEAKVFGMEIKISTSNDELSVGLTIE